MPVVAEHQYTEHACCAQASMMHAVLLLTCWVMVGAVEFMLLPEVKGKTP